MRKFKMRCATARPIRMVVADLAWAGLVLALAGCAGSKRGDAPPAGEAHAAHSGQGALELDGGKKWAVPGPMMVHIQSIERLVREFEAGGGDHAVLAASIQENLGGLVTNCTMRGKAHDELHKWLMPVLGSSADYAKAADPQVQRQKLQEIERSLAVFHRYFQ